MLSYEKLTDESKTGRPETEENQRYQFKGSEGGSSGRLSSITIHDFFHKGKKGNSEKA